MSEEATHSEARVTTPLAQRYLVQLCKHFEHKRPVTYDTTTGEISFTIGTCRLQADGETLTLSLDAADGAQMPQLQDVVARHLQRFAFRAPLQIDWQDRQTS